MAGRATIKRRANAAVFQIIDPDDEIVAGTWALTGPPLLLDLLYTAARAGSPWTPSGTRVRARVILGSAPGGSGGPDFEEVLAALRAGGASVQLNGAQRDAIEPV